jgi:hypothetical protein
VENKKATGKGNFGRNANTFFTDRLFDNLDDDVLTFFELHFFSGWAFRLAAGWRMMGLGWGLAVRLTRGWRRLEDGCPFFSFVFLRLCLVTEHGGIFIESAADIREVKEGVLLKAYVNECGFDTCHDFGNFAKVDIANHFLFVGCLNKDLCKAPVFSYRYASLIRRRINNNFFFHPTLIVPIVLHGMVNMRHPQRRNETGTSLLFRRGEILLCFSARVVEAVGLGRVFAEVRSSKGSVFPSH